MKLKILKRTSKGFEGEDGEKRDYFWYVGEREDGKVIRFGSTNGDHEVGNTAEFLIEEYEQSNGRKGNKEITLE